MLGLFSNVLMTHPLPSTTSMAKAATQAELMPPDKIGHSVT